MELRVFKKDNVNFTRVKLSNKQEGTMIVAIAMKLEITPIKVNKVNSYYEIEGDIETVKDKIFK